MVGVLDFIKLAFSETARYPDAHYDPLNKWIHGCPKGSIVWYHEKRHEQQFIEPEWRMRRSFNGLLVLATLTMIAVTVFNMAFDNAFASTQEEVYKTGILNAFTSTVAVLLFLVYWSLEAREELDAWAYAYMKYKDKVKP